MTIADYAYRKVPNYYKTMYLDGYTPQEIYSSFKKSLRSQVLPTQTEEPIEDYSIDIKSTMEVR